jgi:hypothetical protein
MEQTMDDDLTIPRNALPSQAEFAVRIDAGRPDANKGVGYRRPQRHGRFEPGRSGNPKGRPRKPKPPAPSPFAILDELLPVHEPGSVSELPLEDAMLIKTYQRAITGSPRAWKKLVKMILEREKLRFKSRVLRSPRTTRKVEQVDPENALDALEILGIASRTAGANAGDSQNAHLRLERWAVEAALRRRSFEEL